MKPSFRIFSLLAVLPVSAMLLMCSKSDVPKPESAAEPPPAAAAAPAEEGDRGTASASFGAQAVSIDYGRPQLQGRDMLAQATDGMVWRMGMNEATEITTDANLHFGETVIPAGSYSLWMKKIGAEQWHLVFNSKTGIWGSEHSPADDLAAIPLTMSTNPESVERFTVELAAGSEAGGTLKAMWGTHILSADFNVSAAQN